ncbi:hypothetical protein DL96DRAFT_713588 [Flagelloscypha sp. PMI_526]|nr:hypothetical protein DL96DRAFT_713588 [Flagelloscypha sp. PMI_526]
MASPDTSTEPRLPPEIEQIIFLLLASSDPATISTLLLVNSRVKDWIEPRRFRSLSFSSNKAVVLLANAKSPVFLSQHVTYFSVHFDCPNVSGAFEILSLCSGLTDLALWHYDTKNSLPDSSTLPRLRHLILASRPARQLCKSFQTGPELTFPVTHFEFNLSELSSLEPYILTRFPNLTHLLLVWDFTAIDEKHILKIIEADSIQLLIIAIIASHAKAHRDNMLEEHPTLVHPKVSFRFFDSWAKEWDLRVGGDQSVWTRDKID